MSYHRWVQSFANIASPSKCLTNYTYTNLLSLGEGYFWFENFDQNWQNLFLAFYGDIWRFLVLFSGCTFKLVLHARLEVPLHAETIRSENLTSSSIMSTLPSIMDNTIKTTVNIQLPQESKRCFAMPFIRLQLYVTSHNELVYVLNPRPSSTDLSFEYNLIQGKLV